MQKNIKIKVSKNLKIFIFISLFFALTSSAYAKYLEGELEKSEAQKRRHEDIHEKKDNDIEFLPGEEVKTREGKKMKVWSSKGTFELKDGKSGRYYHGGGAVPPPAVIVDKRHN